MKFRALLSLGLLLSAVAAQSNQGASVPRNFVVPSSIEDKEPFTFGITGYVEGEVVDVKTVEGEVIARHKPDAHGRVFLPAGLAAGSYLLTSSGGRGTPRPPVTCVVGPNTGGGAVSNAFKVDGAPKGFNLPDGLKLNGGGFSPNAADMVIDLGSQPLQVMAATSDEMATGPLGPGIECGPNDVHVRNLATGQGAVLADVLCYELKAQLVRRTITGGEQTTLEFRLTPPEATIKVRAQITSGPVTFAGGGSEVLVDVVNGLGSASIMAKPGDMGKFKVAWNAAGDAEYDEDGKLIDKEKRRKQEELRAKRQKAAEQAAADAEKAEKAAKGAEDKGNHEKAAEERKKAADKHKDAAANHRANGNSEEAAEQEREAAENARKQGEDHDKQGKSQKPGKDARRDAAQSEERAARDEQREAGREEHHDKEKAAKGQDRAADGYDRAAKDYKANGEGSKSKDAERAAEGARQEAERLRK